MSTKIKLASAIGGHKAGDTITVTPKVAAYLADAGHVDETKPAAKTPAPKAKTPSKVDGVGGTPSDA